MRLAKLNPAVFLFWGFLFIPVNAFANEKADRIPVAFLPEQTHRFEPVVDGTEVVHDFKLMNKGNAPLVIGKLESG